MERVLQSQLPCSHLENSNIAVIPSLVSLSTDFFTSRDDVYADSSHYGGSDVAAAGGAASSASGVTMLDFPSTFPALGTSSGNEFTPSLRPRQQNNVDSSGGSFMGEMLQSTTEQQQQQQQPQPQNARSVSPPIGPQGAPIPQHILSRMANYNPADAGSESVARGSNIDTEFNEPSSPNPRHIFTTNYQNANVQLSAPARLGQSILHTSNQSTVESSNSKYINVVQSLAEAVKRMEQRLQQGENAAINTFSSDRNTNPSFGQSPSRLAPSTPRRNNASSLTSTPVPSTPKQALHKDNIDELESSTITQLAEIMLHPPIAKVVKIGDGEEQIVRYVWKEEKKDARNTAEKTDLDSHMEGNDDTGVQLLTDPTFDTTSKPRYLTSQAAHASIANLGLSIPRRVCQHPFRKNDIVW